ncbi:hypothetical protein [Paenibacillus sp. P32E]|uniref:hypothetical protein n=1 Tax=Paenibacillus sp. P32E TaxID=1349434 RepID=UPI000938D22D|nr:hypothetical protein [Paenibacillus sp. P32E]OKP88452.1 hypothetical protein A3848_17845 [Paenibacillus sp. P32E]
MYEWIKGYSRVEYSEQAERLDFGKRSSFRMEKMELESSPSGMTAAAQYFTAGNAWLSEVYRIGIPAQDERIRQLILTEIAPHFADVKQCIREGSVETIYLQELKPESRQLFGDTQTGILPVLEDLYRHHDMSDRISGGKRTIINYMVNPDALEPYEAPDTETLQNLLKIAYSDLPDGEYNVMPLGWFFDENLRHSAALRFFAGFVPHLMLRVDEDTGEVILLQMSGKEFARKVLLNSARPQPPRRKDSHLYVDMGHRVVYAIDLSGQYPVSNWQELTEKQAYWLKEGMNFNDFNHETAEPVPANIGFFYDQDSIQSIVDRINQELEDIREQN